MFFWGGSLNRNPLETLCPKTEDPNCQEGPRVPEKDTPVATVQAPPILLSMTIASQAPPKLIPRDGASSSGGSLYNKRHGLEQL